MVRGLVPAMLMRMAMMLKFKPGPPLVWDSIYPFLGNALSTLTIAAIHSTVSA